MFSTVQFSRFNVFFRFRLSPSTFNILSQLFSFVNNFFYFFQFFFQSHFSNSLFLLWCSSFFPANKIVLYSFCKKCQHFFQTFFQKFAIFLFLNFSFLIYRYFKTFNFYCLNAFSAYFWQFYFIICLIYIIKYIFKIPLFFYLYRAYFSSCWFLYLQVLKFYWIFILKLLRRIPIWKEL